MSILKKGGALGPFPKDKSIVVFVPRLKSPRSHPAAMLNGGRLYFASDVVQRLHRKTLPSIAISVKKLETPRLNADFDLQKKCYGSEARGHG